MSKLIPITLSILMVAGCSNSWETSNLDPQHRKAPISPIQAASVALSSEPYDPNVHEKIADLKVTVNKTTAFHPEPTVALVEERLRTDAAKLGASKVVNVEISDSQVSFVSWGTRRGSGVAVK